MIALSREGFIVWASQHFLLSFPRSRFMKLAARKVSVLKQPQKEVFNENKSCAHLTASKDFQEQ